MIEFTGKISGDNECWCFEVDENIYKEIVGERNYEIEKEYRKEAVHTGNFSSAPWRLSPADILEACGIPHDHMGKIIIRIETEKL